MVSSSRARRAVVAAVLAAAVASIGAASAEAKTVTVTDDAADEFAQGTLNDTVVRTPGAVEIAPALEEPFDGSSLPAGWTPTLWNPDGTATVAAGSLDLNGAQVVNDVQAGLGSSLEFTATFRDAANQHVGFATDFNNPPWAIFSTGGTSPPTNLYARTSDGPAGMPDLETALPLPSGPATYRIDWTTSGFVFFVNGAEVASHAIPMTNAMPAAGSDLTVDPPNLSVGPVALRTRLTGKFTSRTLDAGEAGVTGLSLAGTGTGNITYETRTADTAGGFVDDWQPVTGGAVASSPKRYLQYRATLTTPDPAVTPSLDKVEATFTLADPPPPPSSPVTPPGGSNPVNPSNPVYPSGDAPDGTKPTVLVMGRSARVTKNGVAKLRVRCPRSEQTCDVAVKLKLRGKRIASKSKTLSSGATGTFRLKLSGSARIKLAARSSLSATAVVSAEDAAGNRRKTKHRVTLLAPGR
jgi:hypothetical protein